jgi:CheY-like chemotaxis protein
MLRALIIEDEPVIGLLLQQILGTMGHVTVGIEGTEAGAVAAAERLLPSLLLVDFRLRQGTGAGALQRILAARFVPHVLMSGDGLELAGTPGCARIQKPFSDRDLERAIAQATGVEWPGLT